MTTELKPVRQVGGYVTVPGDKSVAHRAALLSVLATEPLTIRNFPDSEDCARSLEAAQSLGVTVEQRDDHLLLTPPETVTVDTDKMIDCGNSGTTVRLLSGILAGLPIEVTLTGDESLSRRPMKRIIEPLTTMGAELFADDYHLPMRIRGNKLLPFEYRLPVASAQVKSCLLLAGLSSRCSVTIREDMLTRDHTEHMIRALGGDLQVRDIKPVYEDDPRDPRKRRLVMPEDFKREIVLAANTSIKGGEVDIPGDISTAAFFFAAAAIGGGQVTIDNLGLNPTRTGFLDHLKAIGCSVKISGKETISGEPRGSVTVTGGPLKARKITGDHTVALIDEVPIIAVMAAFSDGTTVIRDAAELRVKESDRLQATADNLERMGVKVGLLDDGLAIEGAREVHGTDIRSFGDHRIAMAFTIGSLFAVGPSTLDDDSVVGISCPSFFDLLKQIAQ